MNPTQATLPAEYLHHAITGLAVGQHGYIRPSSVLAGVDGRLWISKDAQFETSRDTVFPVRVHLDHAGYHVRMPESAVRWIVQLSYNPSGHLPVTTFAIRDGEQA